jgi:peptide chain release factor 2
MSEEIEELEQKASEQGFWDDIENSQVILKKIKILRQSIDKYISLKGEWEDLEALNTLGLEENDESVILEVKNSLDSVEKKFEKLKLEVLLTGDYDYNNAILTLHSGAGGTEAQDWVQMILRMYTRWAESKDYEIKTLDFLAGDEAGIKSVTILIKGENAYGFLKSEKGVHRLVRISPFDASGRRHTSFASVDVMPEIDDAIEIEVNPSDLKVDTYRASGAGGQHINKTDSAVRLTHLPTGIVVACQNERSQFQNKDTAMRMLKAKLLQLKEEEQREKLNNLKGSQKEIGWGSQIRSYVFCPYTLVKDHRTNFEDGNVGAIMDGNLDDFINSYLSYIKD